VTPVPTLVPALAPPSATLMATFVASSGAMDLRQLTHLLAVAEHGSFSAAARSLHTVQSNVSTHVARLEKELDAVLIDRRSMLPTAEGEAVLERAQRIRIELQALEDDIQSMREDIGGTVRIGCIGTTARWMATPLLERLGARYPALHPVLVDAASGSLHPQLRSGEVDLAVLNGPVLEPDIETEPLFDEELVVVSTFDHPLADHESVTTEQLAEHEVMLTPVGTTFRDTLDTECGAAGIRLRPKVEVDGLRLLTSLAWQGYAPAILPASAASGFPAGTWAVVRIEGLERRPVLLARHRRTSPSLPVQAAAGELRSVIRDMGPHQPGIHVTMAAAADEGAP